jgi:hypothetical protein
VRIINMNRLVISLLVLCAVASAQTQRIARGSSVYIEPMDGYGIYLTAAFIAEVLDISDTAAIRELLNARSPGLDVST